MSPRLTTPSRGPRILTSLSLGAVLLCACGVGDEVSAQELTTSATAPAGEAPPAAGQVPVPDEMQDFAYLAAHTPSGQATSEWNGKISGMKTLWHASGAKRGEGEYVNSEKSGTWTYWHDNGQKRWEGTYERDLPQGLERTWYDDGTQHYVGSFTDGLREGPFSYWHENGQLWWKGPFEHDIREGAFIQWTRNGEFDEQGSGVYVEGKRVRELSDRVRIQLLDSLN